MNTPDDDDRPTYPCGRPEEIVDLDRRHELLPADDATQRRLQQEKLMLQAAAQRWQRDNEERHKDADELIGNLLKRSSPKD